MSGTPEQDPPTLEAAERRARAAARRVRATLRKSRLGVPDHDFSSVRGAEAISLVTELTRQAASLSGQPLPTYTRAETTYRFVAGSRG